MFSNNLAVFSQIIFILFSFLYVEMHDHQIGINKWCYMNLKGQNVMKNYLSDPQSFTHNCPGMFVEGVGNSIYSMYKDNTKDFLNSFINQISVNTNNETVEQLTFAFDCFVGRKTNGKCPEYTKYLSEHNDFWGKESGNVSTEYQGVPGISMEVFHFVHGLRFTHEEIKDYVRDRDIVDLGAYVGESAVKLSEYTDKKVYSYELSPKLYNTIKETIKKRNLEGKITAFNKGIDRECGKAMIDDVANLGGSLSQQGSVEVKVTSIDNEVETLKIHPGFIKADIEGFGLRAIYGADKTIKKYRPVIEIACYHSYDELIKLPLYLRKYPNYIFTYHPSNGLYESMGEISFFAYPAEILYPLYPGYSTYLEI